MKKKVKINYLTKDVERSHNSNTLYTKFVSVVVEGRSTKRYHNSIGVLVQLGKCARILLDFLVEIMDENNHVNNNQLLKKDFNHLLLVTGQKPYGPVTINKAFSELSDHELLNTVPKKKGTYQINPLFFFNGPEKKREETIRAYLEKPIKGAANKRRRLYYDRLRGEE